MQSSYQSPSSPLRGSLPRQLYTPRQREHIINLHRLRLMFILCERAARDKPIKNRIYCSLKATRKVIAKFQRRAHCLPICVQWKRTVMEDAAKVIHFNTQVNPLFPRTGKWPSPYISHRAGLHAAGGGAAASMALADPL